MYYYNKKKKLKKETKILKCKKCLHYLERSKFETSTLCIVCHLLEKSKLRCKKCLILRDDTDFNPDKRREGGRQKTCKHCKVSKNSKL